ncbi:methyltransferase domain-containing protein [Nocardia sp. 2]|uniref:Methyltransferase domain-containing protein n=2 Tax=Nocardia acididurans TaxID=2802282 RepID=A0ABS1MD02_9NOCA|nr:methyltransferase domain-containing protein [Nocardia acididurans]
MLELPRINPSTLWRNRAFEAVWGSLYNAGIEHRTLARPVGWALFGTDARLVYRNLEVLQDLPPGTAVLDVPCGGGIALDALPHDHRLRYIAADISPSMLERAEEKADRLGLTDIDFVEADIHRMPFSDGHFDLVLTLNGLHCLPDPAAAVRELARVLKPGGRLFGDCIVRGAHPRGTVAATAMGLAGVFGPGGTATDLAQWFADAGLDQVHLELSGAVAHFDARRPL